jgi:hypothetical protein
MEKKEIFLKDLLSGLSLSKMLEAIYGRAGKEQSLWWLYGVIIYCLIMGPIIFWGIK